jgi:hypothetical protein
MRRLAGRHEPIPGAGRDARYLAVLALADNNVVGDLILHDAARCFERRFISHMKIETTTSKCGGLAPCR